MKKLLRIFPIVVLLLLSVIFFKDFFLSQKLPIPSDTIIGLYNPYRDLYAKNYPNGIPYKNFLITDPVRQQYPWRKQVIEQIKKSELPLWNPYEMTGTVLLGNIQSGALYPFNIIFFVLPFSTAWSYLIFLQPLLSGIFLYFFLRKQKIDTLAALFGALSFSFSGFLIAWLEWGTIGHVALWLPLLLLCVDFLVEQRQKHQLRLIVIWSVVYIVGLVSAFFAGHLQTFFYEVLFIFAYFIFRLIQNKDKKNTLLLFILLNSICFIITSIQWLPLFQLINVSGRMMDQADWTKEGWFIPWQHAVQFIVPDFFGNPTTLNYWGVWNYGELIGYIGIIPLLFVAYSFYFLKNKTIAFFTAVLFLSILFSFPTGISSFIYQFSFPFISTAQPTRLLFVIDFSLCVLATFGFSQFMKNPQKKIFIVSAFFVVVFSFLWIFVFFGQTFFPQVSLDNISVTKRNLIIPTIFLFVGVAGGSLMFFFRSNKKLIVVIAVILFIANVFDLFRFGWKFTPFTQSSYLFPTTKITSFLQNQQKPFRIMTTDSQILPPNFSTVYNIESVDIYDPLFIGRYAELIAAIQRGGPNIHPPFGFNRIITPHVYNSKITSMLGVKYILTFSDIKEPSFVKVMEEGKTKVYENKNVIPRAVFVENIIKVSSKQDAINSLFNVQFDPLSTAIVEGEVSNTQYKKSIIVQSRFGDNKTVLQVNAKEPGFLVIFDTYYPSVHATIDGEKVPIYRTNFNFRGIEVPVGVHTITFSPSLF